MFQKRRMCAFLVGLIFFLNIFPTHTYAFDITEERFMMMDEEGKLGMLTFKASPYNEHDPADYVSKIGDGIQYAYYGIYGIGADSALRFYDYSPYNDFIMPGDGSVFMEGVVDTTVRKSQCLFLKKDGSLWAIGDRSFVSLGVKSDAGVGDPVKVMSDVVDYGAGESYAVAVKKDGSLWFWGTFEHVTPSLFKGWKGGMRQYEVKDKDGTHTAVFFDSPVQLINKGVQRVYADGYDLFILMDDHRLYRIGDDIRKNYNKDNDLYAAFQRKAVTDDVVSVATNNGGTLVLLSSGLLIAKGDNNNGRLGTGDAEDLATYKEIMEDVSSITMGEYFSVIVKKDGSVWRFGAEWGAVNIQKDLEILMEHAIVPPKVRESVRKG